MIKVNLVGGLSVEELLVVLNKNVNGGFYEKEVVKLIESEGSGVYEFNIGSRGMLEDVRKNDEYMSLDEVIEESLDFGVFEESSEEEVVEYYKEFYGECDFDVDEKEKECVFGIGYEEESVLLFVNVVV
jgi:hypothetical protein